MATPALRVGVGKKKCRPPHGGPGLGPSAASSGVLAAFPGAAVFHLWAAWELSCGAQLGGAARSSSRGCKQTPCGTVPTAQLAAECHAARRLARLQLDVGDTRGGGGAVECTPKRRRAGAG